MKVECKDQQPNAEDWLRVGNLIRSIMGIPELNEPLGIPNEYTLELWEQLMVGSRKRLVAMAEAEMEHRLWMQENSKGKK